MKRPENKDIDGTEYQIYHMGPKRQIKLMKFIATVVGKPMGVLSEVEEELNEDGSKKSLLDNTKVIGTFIKAAIDSLDDDKIIEQIEKILEYVERKDGKGFVKVQMEKDFHGELAHLFSVVAVALEVNFGRFLGVNTGLLGKLKGRLANKSKK